MKYLYLLTIVALVAILSGASRADWGDPIKWSQNQLDEWLAPSYIDPDMLTTPQSADDFLCTETGYITDIHFWGLCLHDAQLSNDKVTGFRVSFYGDVPKSNNDASHPGDLLWRKDFGTGVYQYLGSSEWRINIPQADWFLQQGSRMDPMVYWIGIQGITEANCYADRFYWRFRDHGAGSWNDDAAYCDNSQYPPWYNWGLQPGLDDPQRYDGLLPDGWQSIDMAFELSGRPVPEPSSLLALLSGLGFAGAMWRRKK